MDKSQYKGGEKYVPLEEKIKPLTELELELKSLEEQTKKEVPENIQKAITKIGKSLRHQGLSIIDACLLVGCDYKQIEYYIKINPNVKRYIELKDLQYKTEIMTPIIAKAKSGNDKLGVWLLGIKDPEKYNPSNRPSLSDNNDLLADAIAFIQKNGDSEVLISSKQAVSVKKNNNNKLVIESVEQILS